LRRRVSIGDWPDEANAWSDNPVGAFDFPLRWRLGQLCDGYGFRLRNLAERGVLVWDRPAQAVTFVENHDVVRNSPIINDKLLAYAFILTHEGYPCVFWQDYFNWDLAQPDAQTGIDALIMNKMPPALRKCFSWTTISTSCNAQAAMSEAG
jgi:alpha-amylase